VTIIVVALIEKSLDSHWRVMADNHDKTKKASGIAEAKQQGRKLLSIVVPCFNEQEVIALTHERILSVLGGRPDLELELIYIDDGSSDNTSAILYNIARSYQRVTILTLTRNFGHQAAVSAGLHYASPAPEMTNVGLGCFRLRPPFMCHRGLGFTVELSSILRRECSGGTISECL
jgi:cellulose synthase/poly-beta-1,6-N-acetylglucosamine synthase-like glycosyltransferase